MSTIFVYVLLVLLVLLVCYVINRVNKQDEILGKKQRVEKDMQLIYLHSRWARIIIAIPLLIVLIGTIWMLYSSFNPSNEVYMNAAHHVVQLDGIKIANSQSFKVAASSNAFVDRPEYHGSITLQSCEEDFVVLSLNGFTQGVYQETYNAEMERKDAKLLNTSSLLQINTGDTLCLTSQDNEKYKLFWEYYIDKYQSISEYKQYTNLSWFNPLLYLDYILEEAQLKCRYMVKYQNKVDTLAYNNVITKAIGLNTIYAQHYALPNLGGCNLLRNDYKSDSTRVSPKDSAKWANTPFFLEITNACLKTLKPRDIQVKGKNGNIRSFTEVETLEDTIRLPIGNEFSISTFLGTLQSKPMKFARRNGELTLEFVMPLKQYLSAEKSDMEQTIWIATSLSEGVLDETADAPDNIVLFDVFYTKNNPYNLEKHIELAYRSGKTNQDVSLFLGRETGTDECELNKYIGENLTNAYEHGINWLVKVVDFKQDYLQEQNIITFAVLFILAMAWAYWSFAQKLWELPRKKGEPIYIGRLFLQLGVVLVFVVVALFFTFRLLLLWRAAVFPPVETITIYEFLHFFRNSEILYWQLFGVSLFYTIVVDALWFLLDNEEYKWYNWLLWFFLCAIIVGGFLCFDLNVSYLLQNKLLLGGFILILCNVGLLLYLNLLPGKGLLFIGNKEEWCKSHEKLIKWCKSHEQLIKWCILLLYVVASICSMTIKSSTVTILFPLFTYFIVETLVYKKYQYSSKGGFVFSSLNGLIISVIFLIADGGYGIIFFIFFCATYLLKLLYVLPSKKWFLGLLIGVCIVFAGVLGFLSEVLEWLYKTDSLLENFLLAIVCAFLAVFLVAVILTQTQWDKLKRHKELTYIVVVISGLFVGGLLPTILDTLFFRDHIEQRVIVKSMSTEEGLLRTQNAQEQSRFFNASINDYILSVYNREVNDDASHFVIQPHSRIGAMYGAQASDILLARFVHAEHSRWLPLGLICLFALMLVLAVMVPMRSAVSKMLLVQIPMLLFLHSLFVWLANMRLFIFLGQDFPLLSFHSKLTILYFFLLTAVWFVLLVRENIISGKKLELTNKYRSGSMFCMLGCLLIIIFIYGIKVYNVTQKPVPEKYSLKHLLEDLDKDIDKLNAKFIESQTSNNVQIDLRNVTDIVRNFNDNNKVEIQNLLGGETNFAYRMWNKFVTEESKSNSGSSLIHVRRIKIPNGTKKVLKFDVRTNYFDKQLPVYDKYNWTGNIVTQDTNQVETTTRIKPDVQVATLKKGWSTFAGDKYLRKTTVNQSVITNTKQKRDRFISQMDNYTSCFIVHDGDKNITVDNIERNYIARNLVINSKRTFFYPLKDKFFWAYTLAEELMRNKDRQRDTTDIELTLDKRLQVSLYDAVKYNIGSNNKYFSVIVADGDGNIKAMVDYEKGFELDPNDTRTIAKLNDELYLDYDQKISDAYFGEKNLLRIPGGPGSTQKPMVWTAVASQINFNWKDLKIYGWASDPNYTGPESVGGKYSIRVFGGCRMFIDDAETTFTAPKSPDENRGKGVDLKKYMSHSSNYYNALMLYLGMHKTVNVLHKNDSLTNAFAKLGGESKNDPNKFPLLKMGEHNDLFYLTGGICSSDEYGHSYVYKGLNNMFNMDSKYKMESICGSYLNVQGEGFKSSYAYVQTSLFGKSAMKQKIGTLGFAREALHQAAVGGQGMWEVTPLFMAQSFGRLVSLNKNYKLSINARQKGVEYEMFDNLSEEFIAARDTFLLGMHEVFSAEGATAKRMEEESKDASNQGFYFYGKTGTSNDVDDTNHRNLHRMGIVITNRPIHADSVKTKAATLKDMKFYTLYITGYENQYFELNKKIVKSVIESEVFKNYMQNN